MDEALAQLEQLKQAEQMASQFLGQEEQPQPAEEQPEEPFIEQPVEEEPELYSHYITIDEDNRIVAGFTNFDHEPTETDICIRDDSTSKVFELFGKDQGRPLFFHPIGSTAIIYLYKYEDNTVLNRTKEEIDADLPEKPYEPETEDLILETLGDHEFRLCLIELGVN